RKAELISTREESGGIDAGAGQQELVRHLSHYEAGGEGRKRKDRGTPQDTAKGFGEFPIGDGVGRHGIHRAAQGISKYGVRNGSHQVVNSDPAQVLASAPYTAAATQFERQKHG